MRLTFDVDDRIHMDYLAYLFERDTSGAYIVTARNCFGKLIIGHTQAASLPPREACGKFAVTFILPINEATQNFQNKFIYLSAQATKQSPCAPTLNSTFGSSCSAVKPSANAKRRLSKRSSSPVNCSRLNTSNPSTSGPIVGN